MTDLETRSQSRSYRFRGFSGAAVLAGRECEGEAPCQRVAMAPLGTPALAGWAALADPRPIGVVGLGELAQGTSKRRECRRLRDGLRAVYPKKSCGNRMAVAGCGYTPLGPVAFRMNSTERNASTAGTVSCNSVWACPCCAGRILADRASQVRALVKWSGTQGHAKVLATLTVRHGFGDSVERLVRGISRAWRAFWSGREAQALKVRLGLVGWARRIESTYGPNGFHPHVHAVILSTRELTGADWADVSARWRDCVESEIGPAHRPDADHGVRLDPIDGDGDYIAKAGLELGADFQKDPLPGHRSIWGIAQGAADGEPTDLRLWLAWWRGTKGTKLLTWSTGLRERAGVGEDDAPRPELETLATVTREEWRVLRDMRDAIDVILCVAEGPLRGPDDVRRAIDALLALGRARPPP